MNCSDCPAASVASIYCYGPVLDAIQKAQLFDDSKHFVDMVMKVSPDIVLRAFESLPDMSDSTLREFISRYFDAPGSDLYSATLKDYEPEPKSLRHIKNLKLRVWAFQLNELWTLLARKCTIPQGHFGSLLRTQYTIITPGGRFRESYYWDSYWIVQGLLKCDMIDTARGVVLNLLGFVNEFGFVPNGGRIYYLNRSQPPLLSEMVRLIYTATQDTSFIENALPLLEKEYKFWMQLNTHAVSIKVLGNIHILNRYFSSDQSPRPESYREDNATAALVDKADRGGIFQNIIAAAESGWDFSSRWFKDAKTMSSIDTANVIPVDLNAVMYRFENNLATFHKYLKNTKAAKMYESATVARKNAIQAVLWSSKRNTWKDYFLDSQTHSTITTISDYTPLWANAYDCTDIGKKKAILTSLNTSGLILDAGIQTTMSNTGQQWDGYNSWAPLVDMTVEGLLNMADDEATNLAVKLIVDWINTGYSTWVARGQMMEKYNASILGGIGYGGEYDIQIGFGWSNGVMLKFLTDYEHFYADSELLIH